MSAGFMGATGVSLARTVNCGLSPYESREGTCVAWAGVFVLGADTCGCDVAACVACGVVSGAPKLPVSGAFCVTGFCSAASIDISDSTTFFVLLLPPCYCVPQNIF